MSLASSQCEILTIFSESDNGNLKSEIKDLSKKLSQRHLYDVSAVTFSTLLILTHLTTHSDFHIP